jgi:hypothetical protein
METFARDLLEPGGRDILWPRDKPRRWHVEAGEWTVTALGLRARSSHEARLWLEADLPPSYALGASVLVTSGMAGVSFGHLKNYAIGTEGYRRSVVVEASTSQVTCYSPYMSHGSFWLEPSWRNCNVVSRADLGRRVCLVVAGGEAEFDGFAIRPLRELSVDNVETEPATSR